MYETGVSRVVALADGAVDLGLEVVTRAGKVTTLTTREAALFAYLASRPGQAVSRDELQTEVWGYSAAVVSRTVDTTVRRLRTKIEVDPAQPAHLQTVHGQGYRFQPLEVVFRDRVGRVPEVAAIEAAIDGPAKVGVVGVAGVGKTRLLHEVAARARSLGRPVVWCDVGGATTPAALARSIASTIRMPLDDEDLVTRVGGVMVARGGLWVLDGLEPGSAPALAHWPSWVAFTCRERPAIPGIAWIEIGPLPADQAAALFDARARAADPTFQADPGVVAAIVERLDHLPLAIELAAARIHVLSARLLLERLVEPMRVLGGGTLHRAMVAAWEALSPTERETLAQCTVFREPFSLEAAEQIVVPSEAGASVIDALQALRDRSLVHARRTPGELRFSLLHGVRAFAARHVDDPEALRERHRTWVLDAGRTWVAALDGSGADHAFAELRGLRADLCHAVEGAVGPIHAGLALVLDQVLEVEGSNDERAARLTAALRAPHDPADRADLLRSLAEALRIGGRVTEALESAQEAVALAPSGEVRARALVTCAFVEARGVATERAQEALAEHPSGGTAVRAWLAVARDAHRRGERLDTEHALRRALEVVRASQVLRYEGVVLSNIANLRREAGLVDDAERLYRRAREVFGRLGQVRAEAAALHNLGALRAEVGDVAGAVALTREALAVARAGGELALLAHVQHTLGHLLHRRGELEAAEGAYLEAVGLLRGIDPGLAASALGDLGALLADRGLVAQSERTLAEAEAGLQADSGARQVLEVHRAHLDIARAREAPTPEERYRYRDQAAARIAEACRIDGERCRMAAQLALRALEELG